MKQYPHFDENKVFDLACKLFEPALVFHKSDFIDQLKVYYDCYHTFKDSSKMAIRTFDLMVSIEAIKEYEKDFYYLAIERA